MVIWDTLVHTFCTLAASHQRSRYGYISNFVFIYTSFFLSKFIYLFCLFGKTENGKLIVIEEGQRIELKVLIPVWVNNGTFKNNK